MGYDISDYKSIDPRYGTLANVDALIKSLNDHDMKLIMDLVVTRTSDQHEWFIESSRSKDSPKRDWYIWKPARGYDSDGKPLPPNNWAQILNDSRSVWIWSEMTQEFYLALHTAEQVDLNWENPDVVAAVHDVSSHCSSTLVTIWLMRTPGYALLVISRSLWIPYGRH
jgi:glycosidase